MRLLLDEQACESQATSIGEAIAAAADQARRNGRVLVEIIVDGATWTQVELASPESCSASAGEVLITTAILKDLVRQTLQDSANALTEADALQRGAAEDLRSDRNSGAMSTLGEALAIWVDVRDAVVRSAEALDIDLEKVVVDDVSMNRHIELLGDQLRSMRDALESDDPVGLADTLLYDLPQVVADWRELLDTISHQIAEGTIGAMGVVSRADGESQGGT